MITATGLQKVFDRSEFRDGLKEMRNALMFQFDISNVIRINRVLYRRNLFEQVYDDVMNTAANILNDAYSGQEFGDGELFKWFLEWLEDGGWETILKIIKEIISLFPA